MKNSCDSCRYFTKTKELQNTSGLCEFHDCRLDLKGSRGCKDHKSIKYRR